MSLVPKVSVSIITYNHRDYIAQAVESALMQETDFDYEILIGEDDSSDGTREIVVRYKEQHPDRIRLFLNERKNVIYIDGKPTGRWNLVNNLKHAQGQYVALLEGDDYWTSPHKLQSQAGFLDGHPGSTICFHPVERRYEGEHIGPAKARKPKRKTRYTLEDLLKGNFIATCSVMFRNRLFADFPQWFYTTPSADWPLHVLNAHYGDIGFIDEAMAVHRTHSGGIWSPKSSAVRQKNVVATLKTFRENLDPKYSARLDESLARGHWKVLRALMLERHYRAMGSYARELLEQDRVSKSVLVKAGVWTLLDRIGWTS
jgi:glycosyltransferase involved in cell wall biosynthesis